MISRIIKDETVRRLRHLIADAGKIAIICHVGPDGDAVGASLALAHVLGALGKEARCIIPDATSSLLMQLPEAKDQDPREWSISKNTAPTFRNLLIG